MRTFSFVLLAFCLLFSSASRGALITSAGISSYISNSGVGSRSVNDLVFDSSIVSLLAPLDSDLGGVSAQTDYGVFKAIIDTESRITTINNTLAVAESWAMVTSGSTDTVIIEGGTGLGTLTMFWSIDAAMSVDGDDLAQASMSYNLRVNYGAQFMTFSTSCGSAVCYGPFIDSSSGDDFFADGILSASFSFAYNTPIGLQAYFSAVGGYGGDLYAGHTVELYFGLPGGATINSLNGAMYKTELPQAVPEPSVALLVALGLVLLILTSGQGWRHLNGIKWG